MPFADGGGVDNLAVTLLLRRKVAKIIICVAALAPSTNTTAEEWTSVQYDIAGLFGAVPVDNPPFRNGLINGMPVEHWNRMLKVTGWEGWVRGGREGTVLKEEGGGAATLRGVAVGGIRGKGPGGRGNGREP